MTIKCIPDVLEIVEKWYNDHWWGLIYCSKLQMSKRTTNLQEDLCDQQRPIILYIHPVWQDFLVYPSLASLEVIDGTYDQRRLWSDCADAQADLSDRTSLIVGFVVRGVKYEFVLVESKLLRRYFGNNVEW